MRIRRVLLACFLVFPLLTAVPQSASAAGAPTFIITLRDSASPREVAAEHEREFNADVEHVYEHALRGYAAKVSEARIGELARDSRVVRVERDGLARKAEVESWGIDRIDQRTLPLSDSYAPSATGAGVTAYVIDTGIDLQHSAFAARVSAGVDYVDNDASGDDCDGHGTHVAGTIGGTAYGVATGVELVAVRVLDCEGSGYWSDVIAGVDWVKAAAALTPGPDVANMSLGGGGNSSVDSAVSKLVNAGVPVAVAAGNSGRDACFYSPARVANAITVGATTNADARSSYSNWGACVDMFAPGTGITSAWIGGGEYTISGTSMASPHAAGVAALHLAAGAAPGSVRDLMYSAATKGIVTSAKSANNHLIYWGTEEQPSIVEPAPTKPGNGKGGGKNSR